MTGNFVPFSPTDDKFPSSSAWGGRNQRSAVANFFAQPRTPPPHANIGWSLGTPPEFPCCPLPHTARLSRCHAMLSLTLPPWPLAANRWPVVVVASHVSPCRSVGPACFAPQCVVSVSFFAATRRSSHSLRIFNRCWSFFGTPGQSSLSFP